MQKQSCRCRAAWPGRWSFPGGSCPAGGRGPIAPPGPSLKGEQPHSAHCQTQETPQIKRKNAGVIKEPLAIRFYSIQHRLVFHSFWNVVSMLSQIQRGVNTPPAGSLRRGSRRRNKSRLWDDMFFGGLFRGGDCCFFFLPVVGVKTLKWEHWYENMKQP